LTYRVRTKAFACLLRQEMAYFDQPENSSSSISVRLSSDATALEQMVGARIGAICEAVAMSLFGFVFGIFFSWQLTMIVFITFVIMLLTFYLYLHADIYLSKEPNLIRRDANRVRLDFDLY
jgi:ATP-binding cassette subfamily B (MDR/TAP) protein 1